MRFIARKANWNIRRQIYIRSDKFPIPKRTCVERNERKRRPDWFTVRRPEEPGGGTTRRLVRSIIAAFDVRDGLKREAWLDLCKSEKCRELMRIESLTRCWEKVPRSRGTKYGDGGSLKVLRISPASLPPFTQMPKPWWESGGSLVMVIVLTVSSCRLSGCAMGDVGGFPALVCCCCCCCDCCDCCDCCCCCCEPPEIIGVPRAAVTLAGLDAGDLRSPWRRSETLLPNNLQEIENLYYS